MTRRGEDVVTDMLLESLNEVLLPSADTHIRVLMFIDSVEVERLVVDEKLAAGNVDCADSNWKSIDVLICQSLIACC